MKPTSISAEALFEAQREALRWEWIAGHAHPERRFDEAAVRDAQSAADLVGYLNYIHPYRVQIVGRRFDDVGVLRVARAFEALRPAQRPWPDGGVESGERDVGSGVTASRLDGEAGCDAAPGRRRRRDR